MKRKNSYILSSLLFAHLANAAIAENPVNEIGLIGLGFEPISISGNTAESNLFGALDADLSMRILATAVCGDSTCLMVSSGSGENYFLDQQQAEILSTTCQKLKELFEGKVPDLAKSTLSACLPKKMLEEKEGMILGYETAVGTVSAVSTENSINVAVKSTNDEMAISFEMLEEK